MNKKDNMPRHERVILRGEMQRRLKKLNGFDTGSALAGYESRKICHPATTHETLHKEYKNPRWNLLQAIPVSAHPIQE